MLVASRSGPILSVDSITYLSAAERLRELDGYVDFTGQPLAHFPPVFSSLLAPGGRSLAWATAVAVVCSAAIAVLLDSLLRLRVSSRAAMVGTGLFVFSQATVRYESTVWSETPALVFALAALYVLVRQVPTVRSSAVAGLLAGFAFLTRYAAAGVVLTGLVVIVVATIGDRDHRRRCAVAYLLAPTTLAALWIARNQAATGAPLGPHFEGGAGESLPALLRRAARALGRLVTDLDASDAVAQPAGFVVLISVGIVVAVVASQRSRHTSDVAMATFAVTSIVVPVASRWLAGTDVSARLLSPTLVPVVFFGVICATRWSRQRWALAITAAGTLSWCVQGVNEVVHLPDRPSESAANPNYSRELYVLVAELPPAATVLTNNPQRVWWTTGHFPTLFAFTQPKAGNSHFPLSGADTVQRVCAGDTFLAWFSELANAGGAGPHEVRPDLAELVTLEPVASVPGGELFELVADRSACG